MMEQGPWLEPTLDGFQAFCRRLKLDTGDWWELEDFQLELVKPYFNGVIETGITIPKGNAKSALCAGLMLHHMISTHEPDGVLVAAARDQAGKPFRYMADMVARSVLPDMEYPWLEDYLKVASQTYKMRLFDGIGQVVCKPSDARTVDGEGNTLVLIEEMSHHKSADLYGKLRDGLPKITRRWTSPAGVEFERESGQLISISTAGEDESPWGRMRKAALKLPNAQRVGCKVTASKHDDEGSFAYFEYSLSDEDAERYEDFELVKEANPLSRFTPLSLKRMYHSPSMEPYQWAKDRCGLIIGGEHTAFDPVAWRHCANASERNPIDPGESVWVGVDLAGRFDTAAFVPVLRDEDDGEDFVAIGEPVIIPAPTDGSSMSTASWLDGLLAINERNPITHMVIDLNAGAAYLIEMMQDKDRWPKWLKDKYPDADLSDVEIEGHPQDASPMSAACMKLAEAMRAGRLVHGGYEELTAHVQAAKRQNTAGEKWRIVKPPGGWKIDGAVALAIVHNKITEAPIKPKISAATYAGWKI